MFYIELINHKLNLISIFSEHEEKHQFCLVAGNNSGKMLLTKKQCRSIAALLTEGTLLLFRNETERERFVQATAGIPFRIKKNSVILAASTVEKIRDNLDANELAVTKALVSEGYRSKADFLGHIPSKKGD